MVGLICVSSKTDKIGHILICLLVVWIPFVLKYQCSIFPIVKIGLFAFSCCFVGVLHNCGYEYVDRYSGASVFCQVSACLWLVFKPSILWLSHSRLNSSSEVIQRATRAPSAFPVLPQRPLAVVLATVTSVVTSPFPAPECLRHRLF